MDPRKIFATRWGCNYESMCSPPETHLNYDIDYDNSKNFDGNVRGLRITYNGRWGNYVYQQINMFHIAEKTATKLLFLKPTEIFPLSTDLTPLHDGITVINAGSELTTNGPVLSGVFMNTSPLGDVMADLDADRKVYLAKRYVRPLMTRAAADTHLIDDNTLVIHIRSGDIFWGEQGAAQTGGNLYVQPPLVAYIKIAERAVSAGAKSVMILTENFMNPITFALVDQLSQRQIPVSLRMNQSLNEDLSIMLRAKHLAFSNGSFSIAVAMLSNHIQKAYFYEYHGTGTAEHIDNFIPSSIERHVIVDRKGDYLKIGEWKNTEDQRLLMRDYPMDAVDWVVPDVPPAMFNLQ